MTQALSFTLLDPAHLAALCHELRQPLHAYRLFSDRLTPQLADQQLALASQMNTAIDSLTEMCQTLHEMSHALDANSYPQPRTIELHRLLAELANNFATPRLRVRPSKLLTETDAHRLSIILKHLVRNALQHSGARCLIGCRKQAGEIRLDVIDQGPGFSESTPRQNLEHSTTAPAHPGLGLGLHLVRQLAARLDLRFEIVSRCGHGTRASLFLPDTTLSARLMIQSSKQQQWLTGKTIALVGMTVNARLGLESLLTTWGAQVTQHASSPDGGPAADLTISDCSPINPPAALPAQGKRGTMLILAAPPASTPRPGVRYLPPPTTPPRLRMAITNILSSKI